MSEDFSRRSLLKAVTSMAALAGGGGLLAGCAPGTSRSTADLSYWHLLTGGDGTVMAGLVDAVNAADLGFHTTQTVLAWGAPYYTKLAMASVGGRGPDVAVSHMSRLAGYAPTGLLDPWDLDQLAEYGVQRDDFTDAVWSRTQYRGHTYAVPLDTHPFIVFFHPEPAAKAGLLTKDGTLDAEAFSSPDRFLAAGKELAKASGKQGIAFGYVTDTAQGWRLFYGLYKQTGGAFELPEGGPAKVDVDRMAEVIAFMAKLVDGKVNPGHLDYASAIAAFSNRQTAMILSGEWELGTFRAADAKVNAAPFPTVFGTPAVYADSHSFVLPHHPNPDPEHRRRTHRAVAALL